MQHSLYTQNTLPSNLAMTFANRVSLHRNTYIFEYNSHFLKNRHIVITYILWQNFLEAIDIKCPADSRCSRLVSLKKSLWNGNFHFRKFIMVCSPELTLLGGKEAGLDRGEDGIWSSFNTDFNTASSGARWPYSVLSNWVKGVGPLEPYNYSHGR